MKSLPTREELIQELVQPGTVGAEIGVYRGAFSKELLARKPAKLFLIDAWAKYDEYALDSINNEDQEANLQTTKDNVADGLRNGSVEIVRGFSTEVAARWRTPLKWFFLDSNHTKEHVAADLRSWSVHLELDGFIMCHDYTNREGVKAMNFGVIEAVDQFCEEFGWEITHLTQEHDWPSVALRRKSN